MEEDQLAPFRSVGETEAFASALFDHYVSSSEVPSSSTSTAGGVAVPTIGPFELSCIMQVLFGVHPTDGELRRAFTAPQHHHNDHNIDAPPAPLCTLRMDKATLLHQLRMLAPGYTFSFERSYHEVWHAMDQGGKGFITQGDVARLAADVRTSPFGCLLTEADATTAVRGFASLDVDGDGRLLGSEVRGLMQRGAR